MSAATIPATEVIAAVTNGRSLRVHDVPAERRLCRVVLPNGMWPPHVICWPAGWGVTGAPRCLPAESQEKRNKLASTITRHCRRAHASSFGRIPAKILPFAEKGLSGAVRFQ